MDLKFNSTIFQDLFTQKGIKNIDKNFVSYLKNTNNNIYNIFLKYRAQEILLPREKSEFIIELSMILESFLINFFNINNNFINQNKHIVKNDELFSFKKYYITKMGVRQLKKPLKLSFQELTEKILNQIDTYVSHEADQEMAIAKLGNYFLSDHIKYKEEIELLIDWCIYILHDDSSDPIKKKWSIFALPQKMDFSCLIPLQSVQDKKSALDDDLRRRDGFKLTDSGMSTRAVMNQVNNCMFCHKHEGDYCSKGFPLKKDSQQFSENILGNVLTGCPLNIKISEMLFLKKTGNSIAALATLMIDNPLCPLTGYRICNDCMKSCIYQKQEPVHVPQIETKILKDVLDLPWGVEIYDLLTRWNPLSNEAWLPQSYNGHKVLVIGAGPSGVTMAYHLLQHGCSVVIMDGLKIEKLPPEYIENPIYNYNLIKEELDKRISWGFGGVAQYGITSRWDKNFLKLVYISLARRKLFKVIGGVRFGGTITVEEAWRQGFDHIVIAAGAGLPKELPIPGSLAPGMRQANDFLMALHLTGLAKPHSLTSYQIRLPAVIIGGGLTAVDTATEVQAYYINQVENFLNKYELVETSGTLFEKVFNNEDLELVDEFISHGREIKQEREEAKLEKRSPDFIQLIRKWGGVTIAYRKEIWESPAYRYNHEELYKALQEGILYVENFEPQEAILDDLGHVKQLKGLNKKSNTLVSLQAYSIFIATGTNPNIAYEFEYRGTFEREGSQYKTYKMFNNKLEHVPAPVNIKEKEIGFFTSYNNEAKFVTFIGDTHPTFHGNVVKAIASAQNTYPVVLETLNAQKKAKNKKQKSAQKFLDYIEKLYYQEVIEIKKINNNIIQLVIKAPQASASFSPGQFYRLQLYETDPIYINKNPIYPRAITAFPTKVDKKNGQITFYFSQDNPNSALLSYIKRGQKISIMGPTGNKMKIPENETIIIFGDKTSLNIVNNLCTAYKNNNNTVWYVVCLDSFDDHFDFNLSKIVDRLLYFSKKSMNLRIKNENCFASFLEEAITEVIYQYDSHIKTNQPINFKGSLKNVDHILVAGQPDFIQQFKNVRNNLMESEYFKDSKCLSYVLGPMQCMLKGICGQCLQWQIDPFTKKRTKAVFACSWQCQPIEMIDLSHLMERSNQNHATEKLQKAWFNCISS